MNNINEQRISNLIKNMLNKCKTEHVSQTKKNSKQQK